MGLVKLAGVMDGLRNLVSGLGGGNDKARGATYTLVLPTQQEIDACYRTTWLGRKIHDIPALDMTREWRAWQAEDDQIEAIEKEEKRLQLRTRLRRAITLAKLYGGAALIMGLPGEPTTPAPEKIGKGQLRYVHMVHRHQLSLGDQDRVLGNPTFGQPQVFNLNWGASDTGQQPIHPSRVVAFTGNQLPDQSMGAGAEDWFWGDPLLASVFDALTTHDTGVSSIGALLNEAKVDVIHVPGFMEMVSSVAEERKLMERFTLAALMKSITNTLVLDGGDGTEVNQGERWEVRQMRFEGLPDVQRTLFQLVSGAADIPATRLIGQSPQGMNATGDSDTRNYYDMLSSLQESDMTPTLAPLDEYLIQSATGGRDPSIFFNWNPLWQLSPTEQATRDKTVADTAAVYATMGAIPDDALAVAVQNRLIEDGVFPGLEAALEEAEKISALEADNPAPLPGEMPQPANDPNPPAAGGAARRPALGQGRGSATVSMAGNSRRRAANDRARRAMRDSAGVRERDDVLLLTDAKPRPLYVSRKLLNANEVRTWAERQGFKDLVPAAKMHVTIAASREPVDWLKVDSGWSGGPDNDGTLTVPPGGARVVEPLGDNQGPVLLFSSWELSYRHGAIREAGASWDFEEYQPHVSISYESAAADFDWKAVEPFRGQLRFGPEIFEEFVDDWRPDQSE